MVTYFRDVPEDATWETLGSALCNNCSFNHNNPDEVSKTTDFKIIADAIKDLPEHGI